MHSTCPQKHVEKTFPKNYKFIISLTFCTNLSDFWQKNFGRVVKTACYVSTGLVLGKILVSLSQFHNHFRTLSRKTVGFPAKKIRQGCQNRILFVQTNIFGFHKKIPTVNTHGLKMRTELAKSEEKRRSRWATDFTLTSSSLYQIRLWPRFAMSFLASLENISPRALTTRSYCQSFMSSSIIAVVFANDYFSTQSLWSRPLLFVSKSKINLQRTTVLFFKTFTKFAKLKETTTGFLIRVCQRKRLPHPIPNCQAKIKISQKIISFQCFSCLIVFRISVYFNSTVTVGFWKLVTRTLPEIVPGCYFSNYKKNIRKSSCKTTALSFDHSCIEHLFMLFSFRLRLNTRLFSMTLLLGMWYIFSAVCFDFDPPAFMPILITILFEKKSSRS